LSGIYLPNLHPVGVDLDQWTAGDDGQPVGRAVLPIEAPVAVLGVKVLDISDLTIRQGRRNHPPVGKTGSDDHVLVGLVLVPIRPEHEPAAGRPVLGVPGDIGSQGEVGGGHLHMSLP
jgi:hypothetical protein